jgi:methyl-accepting chemotaxis protein
MRLWEQSLEISGNSLAKQNFERNLFSLRKKNDFLFIYLMLTQWAFSIVCAFVISPYTWVGTESSIHYHVWLAVGFGAMIALPPIYFVIESPGRKLNMYVIAIAQGCFSGLLIHLMGGRIEAHFHIFGSLALLAFYKEWKVLLLTSIIVSLDHLLRGIYLPFSIFGTPEASSWRWLEHSAWVIFEDSFLIYSILQTRADLWKIGPRLENGCHSSKKGY